MTKSLTVEFTLRTQNFRFPDHFPEKREGRNALRCVPLAYFPRELTKIRFFDPADMAFQVPPVGYFDSENESAGHGFGPLTLQFLFPGSQSRFTIPRVRNPVLGIRFSVFASPACK